MQLTDLRVALASGDVASLDTPLIAVALAKGAAIPASLAALDGAVGGAITRTLEAREFRGGRDELFALTGGSRGAQRILLVGTGAVANGNGVASAIRRAAALAARSATRAGTGSVAFAADFTDPAQIEAAAAGLHAGAWQWTETRTPPPADEQRTPLNAAVIVAPDSTENRAAVDAGNAIGIGQSLARTLGMTPGNICTPEFLANAAREVAGRHGMRFAQLDRAGLTAEKMNSFLAVAQGTPQEPRLVTLEYAGGAQGSAPIVLVGKGLCFDSGGISIKPAPSMEWMKYDMSGAGGVIGAMETIGRMKLPINVVGVFGATTNMPSGTAMNPGDVVQSQLGKWIEIINTDAEGRLVLIDLLSYVRRFNPAAVINAATLTGACVIALGHTAMAVMGNDQSLVDDVLAAGDRAGERGWQLPLWDDYAELIKSDVGDIKNTGGRAAGAITAGMFLKEFTDTYPWVHLDIAGTAYSETDLGYIPKGPTGVPVGTFVELVRRRASR